MRQVQGVCGDSGQDPPLRADAAGPAGGGGLAALPLGPHPGPARVSLQEDRLLRRYEAQKAGHLQEDRPE